jgi:hypothetical protein
MCITLNAIDDLDVRGLNWTNYNLKADSDPSSNSLPHSKRLDLSEDNNDILVSN